MKNPSPIIMISAFAPDNKPAFMVIYRGTDDHITSAIRYTINESLFWRIAIRALNAGITANLTEYRKNGFHLTVYPNTPGTFISGKEY